MLNTNRLKLLVQEDQEQGFTLVELLVVILIIGILSAIAIPAFLNQRTAATEATMKSDLRNNATIITGEISTQGVYPATAPAELVKSQGVAISYASNGKSFCLKATHASIPSVFYYDSVLDGMSNNSCSVKLDAAGVFYAASPGDSIIYGDSATWQANGTGPSGEVAMKLERVPNTTPGWGAYGLYSMANGTIPAGSTVKVSYYVKTKGSGNYAFQIINGDATSVVSLENQGLTGSDTWKRVSHTITTRIDWVPNVHSMRWGVGNYNVLEISDVQVDVL